MTKKKTESINDMRLRVPLEKRLNAHQIRQLATKAVLDPRTAEKWWYGETVASTSAACLESAASMLGLTRPQEAHMAVIGVVKASELKKNLDLRAETYLPMGLDARKRLSKELRTMAKRLVKMADTIEADAENLYLHQRRVLGARLVRHTKDPAEPVCDEDGRQEQKR